MLILFSLIINGVFYYCLYCIILPEHVHLSFVRIKESSHTHTPSRILPV